MKWKDITKEHHLKKASVSAKSTPKNPTYGNGTFVGIIDLPKEGVVPVLNIPGTNKCYYFAWWYDVEILN